MTAMLTRARTERAAEQTVRIDTAHAASARPTVVPLAERTNDALVVSAMAGDRAAFDELVVRFEPTVFAVAMRRVRDRTEAAEVAQEVFLRAWRKIDQVREPERFAGWLRQIAARLAINHVVRKPRETAVEAEKFSGVATETAAPWEGAVDAEQAELVRSGIAKLKPLDRDTLVAFYFEGRSVEQMSASFDSPVGTIKRRLHTARARLKEELAAVMTA
ncbi:MAG: sigma-70 family RNA polymerase sigma factor [Planctomycetota bacterium]